VSVNLRDSQGVLNDMDTPRTLLEAARLQIRTRHLSYRTERACLHWISRYVRFHGRRSPRDMGAPEVEQFLTHLAVDRKVSE
jgi:Phage integrase, N-terminal SAM-like domain